MGNKRYFKLDSWSFAQDDKVYKHDYATFEMSDALKIPIVSFR